MSQILKYALMSLIFTMLNLELGQCFPNGYDYLTKHEGSELISTDKIFIEEIRKIIEKDLKTVHDLVDFIYAFSVCTRNLGQWKDDYTKPVTECVLSVYSGKSIPKSSNCERINLPKSTEESDSTEDPLLTEESITYELETTVKPELSKDQEMAKETGSSEERMPNSRSFIKNRPLWL